MEENGCITAEVFYDSTGSMNNSETHFSFGTEFGSQQQE
jgi:hypothetical protein